MSCCCVNILRLCKVGTCSSDVIRTGAIASATGIYTLVLDYLGGEIRVEATINTGTQISFSTYNLNENYTYRGYIIAPNGSNLSITKDSVVYDCVQFQTIPNVGVNEDVPEDNDNELEDIEFVVGAEGYALDGNATYQNDLLIGARIRLIRGHVPQSKIDQGDGYYYAFDTETGTVTYHPNLIQYELIQIQPY